MNKTYLIIIIIISFLIVSSVYADTGKVAQVNYNNIKCTRVVDGDTIELENGEKVRLIGIDTPESGNNSKTRRDSKRTGQDIKTITAMGKRATEFVKPLVEGKQVRLEFDVGKKDRYGRLLAYVWYEMKIREHARPIKGLPQPWIERSKEVMLNAEIVEAGYASPMTYPPNVKYAELFVRLYGEARENNRGLWR